jgi:cell division septal protein FtsQ
MSDRRVRSSGRPIYGRVQPLSNRTRSRGVKRPRLTALQGRLIFLLIAVIVAGWGIGQLFAIKTVTVNIGSRQAAIATEAKAITNANPWWGNLITFDSAGFVAKLQQNDPLLRSVGVRRQLFHTIVVTAVLKQPSLGWNTGNQGYILDKDGTVIGAAPSPASLPVVFDGSNLPVQIGERAVSGTFVEFVDQVVPGLSGQGIGVIRLDIKDTTLDLSAQTNKGYRILFDTSRPARDELNDLNAVLKLLVTQKKSPAEYIDLRIAGKAYYK